MKGKATASINQVPSGFNQTFTIVKYTFLDYLRSKRFFVLLLIVLAIGFLLTGIVGYYKPASFLSSQLSFYSQWWGTSVTFIIIISAVFFGGDAISGEFQNKTGYFMISNPIRRSSVYIGKWLAALSASLIVLAVFTVITIGNGLFYFSSGVPSLFLESFFFAVLYLVSVLGLTFLFSSMFKSNTTSIIVTVILLFFVFSLVQTLSSTLAKIEPWFVVTYGSQIIGNILESPYPAHIISVPISAMGKVGSAFGGSLTSFNATVPEGITIMLVYFVVSFILGLFLFERKEFN